jgi:DNA-binding NtrC family response regulator
MTSVLFVNRKSDHQWIDTLRRVALKVGKSLLVTNHDKLKNELLSYYELIILDSRAIDELLSDIRYIRSKNTHVRIVVISSAPTWKQARQVLLAGATDFVHKVDDEDIILGIIQGNVSKIQQADDNKNKYGRIS